MFLKTFLLNVFIVTVDIKNIKKIIFIKDLNNY